MHRGISNLVRYLSAKDGKTYVKLLKFASCESFKYHESTRILIRYKKLWKPSGFIRIPYAPLIKIHANTLFSKIDENGVFRLYIVIGHYQGTMKIFWGGHKNGEPLIFDYSSFVPIWWWIQLHSAENKSKNELIRSCIGSFLLYHIRVHIHETKAANGNQARYA